MGAFLSNNILEADNLIYDYPDGTRALKGISLTIPKGVTTAVLGGNGAGKSTMLLCLNGILKPSGGVLRLDGAPYGYSQKELLNLRRRVGFVFQDSDSQLFSASVSQDISFGPMNLKLPLDEVRERVRWAMEVTGTAALKDRPTHALSFGQKKRVAIAGVLAMQPDIMIFDEPTAGLDPSGVSEIMHLLRKTQEELGITIVLSTHDIDMVPLFCDKAYVMDRGEMVMTGTPAEVFAQKEELRRVGLRLPRIGHLLDILQNQDDFDLGPAAYTIAEARRSLVNWRDHLREEDSNASEE